MKRAKKAASRSGGRRRASGSAPDRSRRRFLELLASGSAAVLAQPVAALAAAAPAAAPAKPATPGAGPAKGAAPLKGATPAAKPAPHSRANPAEIEKQKRDLAAALKAIRDFELPPGSDPSFVFVPLRPRRSRGGA